MVVVHVIIRFWLGGVGLGLGGSGLLFQKKTKGGDVSMLCS